MYNEAFAPVLTGVVFSGNSAGANGGGMFNGSSSAPVLTSVVFNGNTASQGAGMYNQSSAPVLTRVVFTGNSAGANGGGMFNGSSSAPVLTGVVFTGNTATTNGGAVYSVESSPRLFNVVFTGNSATGQGGAMYNDNDANLGPLIVNTIFAGNTAGVGNDIAMRLDTTAGETIRIAGSVLGIGLANPTNRVVSVIEATDAGPLSLTYHSLANTPVNFGANATIGGITYPTISGTSSAKDLGLYVRRSGTDYYFSENTTTWYTNFTATGGFGSVVTLPTAGVEDLTATDIAGNPRVGRPDAGVYEVR